MKVRRVDRMCGSIHFDPKREDGFLAIEDTDEDGNSTGFLRVDARLTRTGVFEYADREGNVWGELRTEDQVFNVDTLRSFELSVVTDDHPDDFVSSANVKDVQVGTVGTDVRRDGDFMRSSILITDAKAIRSIRDGKIELSCGYTSDVISERGTADNGVSFSARQTNIRGNHVALVSKGRAGADCKLLVSRGDAFTTLTEIQPMKRKIKIGDAEFEVSAEVADALEAEQAAAPTPEPEVATEPAPTPEPEVTPAAPTDDADALRARLDALESDKASEPARIDARVHLVASAQEVLGRDVATSGVTDAALMRAVVLKVRPTLASKLDLHKDSQGYLRASFDEALERHREGVANTNDTSRVLFGALVPNENRDDEGLDEAISNFMLGNVAEGGN